MGRPRRRRSYGSGSVYPRASGRFGASAIIDGVRRSLGTFETREAAEVELARATAGVRGWPGGAVPAYSWHGDAWIERRKFTHRAWRDDESRWRAHVRPALGHLLPVEVDSAALRRMIEAKLAEGLAPQTVSHLVRLVSTMFSDLIERPKETGVSANPVKSLPRSVRRLLKSRHKPHDTPHLDLPDCYRVAAELPAPYRSLYLAALHLMLRTGEVLGLSVEDVDLTANRVRIHRQVRGGKFGPLKDDESRLVPLQSALRPLLAARMAEVGAGPLWLARRRRKGRQAFLRPRTLHLALREATDALGLPPVTWYQATRHSGAAEWVRSGGSMERLAQVLGHSSTEVTRRYAHLRPGAWEPADFERICYREATGKRRKSQKPLQDQVRRR